MTQYRKKPIVIEAHQLPTWDDDLPEWLKNNEAIRFDRQGPGEIVGAEILTLEGVMTASEGDWIIKGVKGELYPCKPYIFAETYEAVE